MPSPARVEAIARAEAILGLYKITKERKNTLIQTLDISNDLEQANRELISLNANLIHLKAEFRSTICQF